MNHPTEDELLLLAYGELPEERVTEIEGHIAGCSACQGGLARLKRGRLALDLAITEPRRRPIVWVTVGLAAAAVLAGVVITNAGPSRDPADRWTPTTSWSTTAGYVTGGKAMRDIDAQLTRLEQERHYGLPN